MSSDLKNPTGVLREVPSLETRILPVPRASFLSRRPNTVVEGDISLTDITGSTTEGLESVQVYQKLGLHPLCPEECTSLRVLDGFLVARSLPLGGGYYGLLDSVYFVAHRVGDRPGIVHANPYDLLGRQRPPKNPSIEELFYTLRTVKKSYNNLYGARVFYISFEDPVFRSSAVDFLVLLAERDRVSHLTPQIVERRKTLYIPLFEHRETDEKGIVHVLDSQRVLRDFRLAKEIS